jgi:cytochrome c oxidase assembly protein Cox11
MLVQFIAQISCFCVRKQKLSLKEHWDIPIDDYNNISRESPDPFKSAFIRAIAMTNFLY